MRKNPLKSGIIIYNQLFRALMVYKINIEWEIDEGLLHTKITTTKTIVLHQPYHRETEKDTTASHSSIILYFIVNFIFI